MKKVMYNGKYIDLDDELEPGYMEFDYLGDEKDDVNSINLEDTSEMPSIDLEDTQIIDLGDNHE